MYHVQLIELNFFYLIESIFINELDEFYTFFIFQHSILDIYIY